MPGHGAAFGRGFLIGAGAALLYAAARESAAPRPAAPQAPGPSQLIDWDWAARVAVHSAGRSPALHPSARAQLQSEYESLVDEVQAPIAAYTGHRLPDSATSVTVMDRADWIRATLTSFRDLLQPVEQLYLDASAGARDQLAATPLALQSATRVMLGSQIGVLVGYLARRVLGQYDLGLLAPEPVAAGKLYFVEPNLRHVERTLDVPRDELRRWIALHEATHAHEFELHPWVRTYLNTSLRRYLTLLVDDLSGKNGENPLAAIGSRLVANLRQGHSFLGALMTPEQRELMSRLQALMSLAEGYSNHVMNTVGRTLLPNFQLIHDRVEARQRRRSQLELMLLRITGLSLKMEQYRQGERFVDHVTRQRGIAFANRAWEAPENLPTEHEIRDPDRWIRRLEAMPAA
jgi:coenzyme F420 biosynthesis associated uncharacterized protein